MTEPDVALTDYGLTLLCLILGTLTWKNAKRGPLRMGFIAFFLSLTFAAACGGTVHGFFLNSQTLGYRILWPMTLISIGMAALSIWGIALNLLFEARKALLICRVMFGVFMVYMGVVLFFTQDYLIAIVHYLPPTIALLGAFLKRYFQFHEEAVFQGIMGLVLTFVAAGIQQAGMGLHPVYFNHNALYHVVQAVGLYMIYRCASHLTSQ